jgi:2-iminobutanoate/2-iminopropanoate deaminase
MKFVVETNSAPKATGPFSQAVGIGNLLFIGGQISLTPEGRLLVGEIEDEVHQVMKNLKAILDAADMSLSDVVKTTIFVTDMSLYGNVNDVYAAYMSKPFPARETVCVKELPLGARVEISMIASRD